MGLHRTYRLQSAILAIQSDGGKRTPVVVPSGALVAVPKKSFNSPLIEGVWDDRIVTLFLVDLKARSRLVRPARAKLGHPLAAAATASM